MYISFYSESMEANQITDYLTRAVQPRITAINGVQKADILGARTFAMRIWLKPQRMAALGITPTEIRNALSSNNYLSTLGGTKGTLITVNLVANTNLKSVNEFKNLVLKERNGSIIRLQDVADIVLGAESYDTDVRFSGQKAIFMGVWVLPTSNSLDVISTVRNELPQIEKQLPSGMHVHLSYDATGYIRDALHEVLWTLSETLLIVICVIFLFLGNWRSILVPVVAIPLSLAGALFLIQTMGSRWGWWWMMPSWWWKMLSATCRRGSRRWILRLRRRGNWWGR